MVTSTSVARKVFLQAVVHINMEEMHVIASLLSLAVGTLQNFTLTVVLSPLQHRIDAIHVSVFQFVTTFGAHAMSENTFGIERSCNLNFLSSRSYQNILGSWIFIV